MPKLHPIQRRFTAGVISPRLHAQSDIDGYSAGLATCRNYVPTKHGMLNRRYGFRFVSIVGGTQAKALPFQLTVDSPIGEAFVVVVSDDGYVSVVGADGYSAGEEVVINTGFAGGLTPWVKTEDSGTSVTWSAGRARLDGGKDNVGKYARISQEVAIPVGKENDDHRLVMTVAKYLYNDHPQVQYAIGTSLNGTDIVGWSSAVSGKEYTINPAGNASLWISLRVGGTSSVAEPGFTPPQQYYRDINKVSFTNKVTGSVVFPHPWTTDQISKIKSWSHPTNSEIYILTGSSEPYRLTFDLDSNSWGFEPITFASTPAKWAGSNWPSVMTFFQGRSWWGGMKDNPTTFWGSVSNDYVNFDLGTGVEPDKAMELEIASQGKIVWMEGIRNLLIGTSNAEYIVTSENGVIYAGDFSIDQQSANGGSPVASAPIGTSAFYISSDARKIYSASFQWTEQTWSTRDITFSAEHLTQNASIIDLTYAKNPENVIWASTSDSKFIGCTYHTDSGQVGWHSHDVNGDVLSLAVIEESGSSNTYAIIRRIVNNEIMLTLEVMDPDEYMDGVGRISSNVDTNVISGMLHLAGMTATVTINEAMFGTVDIDTDGNAVLEYSGREIRVGIPYTSEAKTLPADYGSQTGSGMSMRKGWSSVVLRLLESSKPMINGTRPPDRTPSSPMDRREALFTGDVAITNLGYDAQAQITITEDLPIKNSILGIFGELDQNSL